MMSFLRRKTLAETPVHPSLTTLRRAVHILVIDDEAESFPVKTLQREGYNIEYWPTVESVTRLESSEFDIIILDIVGVASEWTPQDGLGILEHLKKRNPAQIVVAFSGHTFDLSKTSFWKLADDTLPKPVDALKAKQVIDHLLENTFTIQHYWMGIAKLLQASGVSSNKISDLETKLASAIQRGDRFDFASAFGRLFKAGELTLTLISIGDKINMLASHLK
jgi:CheY-like chemotaxis protein